MPTFEAVSALVKRTYKRIWTDWYGESGATPALLRVDPSDESSRYSHSHSLMIIAIPEGNLQDPDILDVNGWPIWKVELVHEMLHEWQMKTDCSATVEAERLCNRYAPAQCSHGHGPEFFQAIIEKAPYFGMTPEQLALRI
jgi:hypothetical protein